MASSSSFLLALQLLALLWAACAAPPLGTELGTFNNGLTPIDLVLDPSGNVIVTDYNVNRIVVFSSLTSATPLTKLMAITTHNMDGLNGMGIDAAGHVYVSSVLNSQVVVLAPFNSSTPLAQLFAFQLPEVTPVGQCNCFGAAVDPAGQFIYAVDGQQQQHQGHTAPAHQRSVSRLFPASDLAPPPCCCVLSPFGWSGCGALYIMAGIHSTTPAPGTVLATYRMFNYPQGISLDSLGRIYVTDQGQGTLYVLAPYLSPLNGSVLLAITANFSCPTAARTDSAFNIFVCRSVQLSSQYVRAHHGRCTRRVPALLQRTRQLARPPRCVAGHEGRPVDP